MPKSLPRQKIRFERMTPLCMYVNERERERADRQGGRESLGIPELYVSSGENNICLSGGCVVCQ